jgi:heme oxygenase
MSSQIDSSSFAESMAGGLAARLRASTAALHARAERSGLVAAMLRGQVRPAQYALLLRNLLPVYRAIENGLQRHRATPWLLPFARPALFRTAAMECDLASLCGDDWAERLRLLPAAARYAHRVAKSAEGDGARLVAHSYVRTLGDLSGGRMLAQVLARSPGLPPEALRFYAYPAVPDMAAAKAQYRAALDALGPLLSAPHLVVREAQVAFRLNIAVSEAVRDATSR